MTNMGKQTTLEDRIRIIKLRKEGYRLSYIAKEVGFTIGTISKVLRNNGLRTNKIEIKHGPRVNQTTKDQWVKMIVDLQERESIGTAEAIKRLQGAGITEGKTTRHTLARWVKEIGKYVHVKDRVISSTIRVDETQERYKHILEQAYALILEGHTIVEASRILGIRTGTLHNMRYTMNMPSLQSVRDKYLQKVIVEAYRSGMTLTDIKYKFKVSFKKAKQFAEGV